MSTWDLIAELPVQIDDYALDPLIATVSSEFERKSTVIRLRGASQQNGGHSRNDERRSQSYSPQCFQFGDLQGH